MLSLKAQKRNTDNNLDELRKAGEMPAVFYGKKEASTPISISEKDFMKVWEEAGESSVVNLKTEDGDKESLIHDVDVDPITGTARHADFYVFEKGHKLEVALPIEFVGISPAVKDLGGTLVKVLHELEIEALPKDLPHEIKIDISVLKNFGDQILASDVTLPEGVALLVKPEEVIALVSAPREEVEEESAPIDLESIEVEKKGKEDDSTESGEGNTSSEGESSEA